MKPHFVTRVVPLAFFASCCSGAPDVAGAQPYPVRPLRVIVPVAAGGGSDFVARLIGQKLAEALDRQVVVDNRPGGGASAGMELGMRALPDGYTLTQITPTYTVNPSVRPVKYDINVDYTPIILEGKGPLALLTHPTLPATSVKELIAVAKSSADRINYGSSGEGTMIHLATELFAYKAQVKFVHVPYKGGGPALIDLIAGQVQLVMTPPQTGMPHVRAGKLRMLGVTTIERSKIEPDVPTIAESGLAGYEVTNWHALIGPKGMPRPVVERLNSEIRKILAGREINSLLLANGVEPDGSTPEQLAAHIRKEFQQWRTVVKATNLKVDG